MERFFVNITSKIKHAVTDPAIKAVAYNNERKSCDWLNVKCPANFYTNCRTRLMLERLNQLDALPKLTEEQLENYWILDHQLSDQVDKPCNLELAVGRELEHRMP